MALGDENVAIRVSDDVVRLIERGWVGRLTGLVAAGLAE